MLSFLANLNAETISLIVVSSFPFVLLAWTTKIQKNQSSGWYGKSRSTGKPKISAPLIRRLPWIEAIGTALASGILYFILDKHELAEFFAVAGSLMALGRLSFIAEMEKDLTELREPLDRIHDYLDLSAQMHIDVFRDMLLVYGRITESEFARVKDGILKEARAQLVFLANEKKSKVLPTTEYYGWLLPMLEKASAPQHIWALSLMRDLEWDTSQPERRFLELSCAAAERGVVIDRVFVIKEGMASDALKNPALQLHLIATEPTNLRGYVVTEEALNKADEELQGRLGDGFLAFDDRVAMVDVFSKTARGYVTMNLAEIGNLREVFDRLRILAEDLDSFAVRYRESSPHHSVTDKPMSVVSSRFTQGAPSEPIPPPPAASNP